MTRILMHKGPNWYQCNWVPTPVGKHPQGECLGGKERNSEVGSLHLTAEHAEDAEAYLVFSAISVLSAANYQGAPRTEWPYWAKLGLDSPVAGWWILVYEGLQLRDVHGE